MYLHILLSVLSFAPLTLSSSISFSVTAGLPAHVSKIVKKNFASFGIQVSSFPYYSGNKTTGIDTYSNNLLDQLTQRTGVEPVLRVGGTNGDSANYDPGQKQPVTSPQGNVLNILGIPKNLTLGPSYFEGFAELQARWVYDAPFDTFNRTNTIAQTQAFFDNVPTNTNRILALELGNEPDLYHTNHMWPDVTANTFATRWLNYVSAIASNVALPAEPIWQGLTLARALGHNDQLATGKSEMTFRPIFKALNPSGYLKSVSVHYYQHTCSVGPVSQSHLLNHTYIKLGLNPVHANIRWLDSKESGADPDIEYVLGETGRYAVNQQDDQITCDQQTGADIGNFAGALWTADMMLYAMTINVTRVHMQLGVNMAYSAWHPVKTPRYTPNTRPIYYAHIFVADAMGTADQTRVAHLTPDTTGSPLYSDRVSGYAIYHSGKLTRVALLNLKKYDAPGTRPEKAYTLNLPAAATSVTIRRLSSPAGAEGQQNISFAGLQFRYVDGGLSSGSRETTNKDVVNGKVDIIMPDSSAALVDVNF